MAYPLEVCPVHTLIDGCITEWHCRGYWRLPLPRGLPVAADRRRDVEAQKHCCAHQQQRRSTCRYLKLASLGHSCNHDRACAASVCRPLDFSAALIDFQYDSTDSALVTSG